MFTGSQRIIKYWFDKNLVKRSRSMRRSAMFGSALENVLKSTYEKLAAFEITSEFKRELK
jgi:hypothetical protein